MPGSPYLPMISDEMNAAGLDPRFAQPWIQQESGFNPYAVSSKGAIGLTQLMPDTAKELGVDPNVLEQNVKGGVKYLKSMFDRYGDNPHLAFAAYNAGPGRVDDYLNKGRELPPETVNYVRSITGGAVNGTPAMTKAMAQQGQQMPVNDNQDTPSLWSKFVAGGPGALFGAPNGVFPDAKGNPEGGYDLGYALQGAGAGLTSIANPAGGAALMNAVNMPLFRQKFSVVTDALGNQVIFNNRTGQRVGVPGQTTGTDSGPADMATALAQSPHALAERAKKDQETSSDTIKALREGAVNAAILRDKAQEALQLLDDPNLVLGGGISGAVTNLASNLPEGLQPKGVEPTQKFQKIAAQLQGQYLSGQKGVRFAGPEIKFSEMSNPDTSKTREVNRQILNDYIRQAELAMQASKLANDHMSTFGVLGPRFNAALSELYKPGASSSLDKKPTGLPKGWSVTIGQ